MSFPNPRIQVIPTYIPFHVTLYDRRAHESLSKSVDVYLNLFPQINKEDGLVADLELLDAMDKARRYLHAFSCVFGIITTSGDYLHQIYSDSEIVEPAASDEVANVFAMLVNLMNHPIYRMLRTMYSVVYEKNRPFASLRDIRWSFIQTHNGLTLGGKFELFKDLTLMLRELVESCASHPNFNQCTKRASQDFNTYITSSDSAVDDTNFAVAVMLAITVLESTTRNTRVIGVTA